MKDRLAAPLSLPSSARAPSLDRSSSASQRLSPLALPPAPSSPVRTNAAPPPSTRTLSLPLTRRGRVCHMNACGLALLKKSLASAVALELTLSTCLLRTRPKVRS
eukprot:6187247-Pleurochrysis_carterae.AAC.2